MIHDDELTYHYDKQTKRSIYKYVNLLYYKQRSLILVSATYCGHLQGVYH